MSIFYSDDHPENVANRMVGDDTYDDYDCAEEYPGDYAEVHFSRWHKISQNAFHGRFAQQLWKWFMAGFICILAFVVIKVIV